MLCDFRKYYKATVIITVYLCFQEGHRRKADNNLPGGSLEGSVLKLPSASLSDGPLSCHQRKREERDRVVTGLTTCWHPCDHQISSVRAEGTGWVEGF